MSRRRPDPVGDTRRAGAQDRDEQVYARKRARQARRRAEIDRARYDPSPPEDEDWTVAPADSDRVERVAPPSPLGEVLERVVQRAGWKERLGSSAAWSRWEEIVGADLAARCEPVRLAGGTLVVRAESEIWATQLRYLGPALAANAARVLAGSRVDRVRIVVGPLTGGEADADA